MSPHLLWPWIATMLVISLSPGAGAVASLSSGAAYGWPRGIWTALGQQVALLLLLAIAALGVASLLVSLPGAIPVLTLAGTLYLGWIGGRLLLAGLRRRPLPRREADAPPEPLIDEAPSRSPIPHTPLGMLWHGFFVNATNPKALLALFVLTPRFIDAERQLLPQYLIIALSMVVIDLVVMNGYTAIGARLSHYLTHARWQRRSDLFFGCLFLLAAFFVAMG